MKKILLFFFAAFSSILNAQITVTSSDFANSSDTVRVSITNAQIDLSQSGANQTWDFSGFVPQEQKLYDFKSMSGLPIFITLSFGAFAPSPYRASYHTVSDELPLDLVNTVLPVNLDEVNLFSKLESSKLTACGYSVSFSGTQIPIKSDTIETYYELPLNFGDAYTSVGYTRLDLNPIQDVQWSQYRQRTSNVDAWGSVTTPFGTFDCIRVKHRIQEIDSIYLSQLQNWVPLRLPEQVIYEWWGNNQKLPLVKVTARSAFGVETITSIEYRDNFIDLTASISEDEVQKINIHPNPTEDFIQIDGIESEEIYQIFDLKGMELKSGKVSKNESKILVDFLQSGNYFIVLNSSTKIPFIKK